MTIAKVCGVEWRKIARVCDTPKFQLAKINGEAAPQVKIYDTFTDTNGTALTAHTLDINVPTGSWVQNPSTPTKWTIQANAASCATHTQKVYAIKEVGVADVTVQYQYSSGADGTIIGNLVNGSNHWALRWSSDGLHLSEITGATPTERDADGTVGPTANDILQLVTNGDTISGYTYGSVNYSVTYNIASRPNKSGTQFGLLSTASGALVVDNFLITL